MASTTRKRFAQLMIKEKPDDILPYLDDVSSGADTAKEELGFLSKLAYQDAALTGKLFVATAMTGGDEFYVGHIMFGGLFPQARIFQLFVLPTFRRHGGAACRRELAQYRCQGRG